MTSGVVSAGVVLIFAIVKFSEGAWLVVVLFPILWLVLMRLNRQYRDEARSLDLVSAVRSDQSEAPHYARHTVLVLVDRLDLAVLRALRYAGSIRPTDIRVVHVQLDPAVTERLQKDWIERNLGDRFPLIVVDCPDRRLVRSVVEPAYNTVISDRAEVTVLLPRRTFRGLWQRILHDRSADRIAEAVGRIPHVAATIVPFDTTLSPRAVERLEARQREAAQAPAMVAVGAPEPRAKPAPQRPRAPSADGITPIGQLTWKDKATIEGRVKQVQVGTLGGRSLEVHVFDGTGGMRLIFFGRTQIPGVVPGATIRATGRAGEYKGHLAIANPKYELVTSAPASTR
jgi:hypothetical protein